MLGKKTLAGVAGVAAAALALAGCGGGEAGDSSEQTLTIWTLTQEPTQREAWEALVAGFEDANPGITVNTEERQTDPHKDALRQAAGTDTGPDLYRYWGGAGLGGELVNVGMSADLTEYYEEFGWAENLTSAALENATQYGGHHGVPMIQVAEALYYNTKLFEEAGITEVPTTYDELVAAADQLVAAGITPIEFGGTVNWHVMRLLDSLIETFCGAETADELTQGDGDWSAEPCVTEAFTELKVWGDNYINEGFMAMSNDDSSQLFYSGQAAMALEGDWFVGMSIDGGLSEDDFSIFPFPTGTGRTYGFGELLYMTPNASDPDAAAAFLDYMISPEGQEALGSAFAAMPVNPNVSAGDGPLVAEWQELNANAEGSYINNDQNFSTAETTEFWRIQNSVLVGDIAPEDAGAQFQAWRDANN